MEDGRFAQEIAPVTLKTRKGDVVSGGPPPAAGNSNVTYSGTQDAAAAVAAAADAGLGGGRLDLGGFGESVAAVQQTGGTIANKSGTDGSTTQGIGIYLNNTSNVVLRRMSITGVNQNFGIRGFGVTNFTLQYCTVGSPTPTNSGSIAANLQGTNNSSIGEGAIYFGNQTDGILGLTGTASIDNCSALV